MSIKKYVKALVESATKEHLEVIYNKLTPLMEISKDEKYNLIISSPLIRKDKKIEFIIDILSIEDKKIENLIKLLVENNRLKELPSLIFLLKDKIAELTGDYNGFVYSKDNLEESKIAEIETKLSNKFNKNIKLTQKSSDKDGIQVYVDSLNVEIAVYENDIKAKLITDIIRAI